MFLAGVGWRRVANINCNININMNTNTKSCSRFGPRAQLELVQLLARPDQSQQVAMVGSLELASGLEIVTDLMEEVDKMSTVVRAWHEMLGDDTCHASLKGACGALLSEMVPLVEMVNQQAFDWVDIDKTVLLAQTSTSRFRDEYAKLKTHMEKASK